MHVGKGAAGGARAHLQDVDKPCVQRGAHALDVLVDEESGPPRAALREARHLLLQAQVAERLLVCADPAHDLCAGTRRALPRPPEERAAQRGRLCAGRPARRAFRMSLLASCCAQAPMQSSMKAKCWWYSVKMTRKMAYFSGKQGDTKS